MPNLMLPTLPDRLVIAGFHALAEPLRLQTLDLLRDRELCVCDLCDCLNVPQSKLSFHLKVLKDAGLVTARQEGRWSYYCLNLPQLQALEQYLASFQQGTIASVAPRTCCE